MVVRLKLLVVLILPVNATNDDLSNFLYVRNEFIGFCLCV